MFSEGLARLVFWLFLALSVPVGLHHQYLDPGVPAGWKAVHAMITFALFLSQHGHSIHCGGLIGSRRTRPWRHGLLGWIRALPWGDPSVTAQLLAMILFVFGGIGGLTNASYNLNLVIPIPHGFPATSTYSWLGGDTDVHGHCLLACTGHFRQEPVEPQGCPMAGMDLVCGHDLDVERVAHSRSPTSVCRDAP